MHRGLFWWLNTLAALSGVVRREDFVPWMFCKVCGCSLVWPGWSIVLEQSCSKPADQGVNHCKGLHCSLGLPTLAGMAGLGAQVSQAEAACCEL